MINIFYKVYVRENFARGNYDIFVVKETPAGRFIIREENGKEVEEKIEESVHSYQLRPNVSLNKEMLQSLLVEITNIGIKLPEQSNVEGRYQAQSEHLKDLRKLLKL